MPRRCVTIEWDAHECEALRPAGEAQVILVHEFKYDEGGKERPSLTLGKIGQRGGELGGRCCR